MDSVKNYFKGGKSSEVLDANRKKRQSARMSMARQSRIISVPSTINEDRNSQAESFQFDALAEKSFLPEWAPENTRLSRFSFNTVGTTTEEVEDARRSFRMSMSGYTNNNKRSTIYRHSEISDIAESVEDRMNEEGEEEMGEEEEESEETMLEGLKHEIMVNYLFQQQCSHLWIADGTGEVEGVILRKTRGNYLACPPALADSAFADACVELNVQCAMTVNSRVIKTFLAWSPDAADVPLTNGLRVQILPTIAELPQAKKNQFSAFIADEALLVVWDDDARHLVKRAKSIEDDLMELVWSAGIEGDPEEDGEMKKGPGMVEAKYDPVTGEELAEERKSNLLNAILVACTMVIVCGLIALGWREVALEISIDGGWQRLGFIAMAPVQIYITLFFAQVIAGSTAQIIGPVTQVTSNSKFYSALLPRRSTNKITLPHVTIQCPVYKEGLESVITPTVRSVKAAMSTYELQGGTCNMLFHDDGLQIINEEDRTARINFYTDHNIGWTARPGHNSDGYVRRGKFKKASNMNFGMMLSCRVEDKLAQMDRHQDWSQQDEAEAYGSCLQEVLDEHGRAWADGNIRIGDYIIIIDSDTRVPTDCILDAVTEMDQSPEVGILQFSSGVMQVTWTYFENGITFFTNLIYSAIKFTVANGDVAPFVGHNAILRWKAVQAVAFEDGLDDFEKFWAENTVSEDFDMALRLQCDGFIVRLAAWAGDGFQEGVSLTVYDELARWEKYAYGCNELLFHPVKDWLKHGLFTDIFKKFVFGRIRLTSKITILAYIGTYYAIASVWLLTIVNYFAIGWFNGYLDKFYLDSWKVWFGLMFVFVIYGNLALAVMRYRIGERSFFDSLFENIKWIPLFLVFLGGLSTHVSQAILSHMFSIDMSWGSTNKEATFSNALIELERVWTGYRNTCFISIAAFVGMIILGTADFVPHDWKIQTFLAWWPMVNCWGAHLLLPFVLNPALMTFSF